jgi:hypothetical protein
MTAVAQRWRKINEQNESVTIAIVRQAGGILKFLGTDAWETYCHSNVNEKDRIISLHCFVKTLNHSIFRNTYQLRDKAGRIATSTHAYVYDINERDDEGVSLLIEKNCVFNESRATSMKNIMDLATFTIVKYIEAMLNSKILKLSVDYVVDTKSQLWMLWTSEANFVRVPQLIDINLPGFTSGDKTGRMIWAGPKYFEGELDRKFEEERNPELARSVRSPTSSTKKLSRGESRRASSAVVNQEMSVSATQLQSASDVIEKTFDTNKSKRAQYLDTSLPQLVVPNPDVVSTGSFPQVFKCKGRFCHMKVLTGGFMAPSGDSSITEHVSEKLFTEKELEILRKDKRFGQMMEFGVAGPALAAISGKSIVLAERDRRSVQSKTEDADWMHYPVTPRSSTIGQGSSAASISPNKSSAHSHGGVFAEDSMLTASITSEQYGKQGYAGVRIMLILFVCLF